MDKFIHAQLLTLRVLQQQMPLLLQILLVGAGADVANCGYTNNLQIDSERKWRFCYFFRQSSKGYFKRLHLLCQGKITTIIFSHRTLVLKRERDVNMFVSLPQTT